MNYLKSELIMMKRNLVGFCYAKIIRHNDECKHEKNNLFKYFELKKKKKELMHIFFIHYLGKYSIYIKNKNEFKKKCPFFFR